MSNIIILDFDDVVAESCVPLEGMPFDYLKENEDKYVGKTEEELFKKIYKGRVNYNEGIIEYVKELKRYVPIIVTANPLVDFIAKRKDFPLDANIYLAIKFRLDEENKITEIEYVGKKRITEKLLQRYFPKKIIVFTDNNNGEEKDVISTCEEYISKKNGKLGVIVV